MVAHFDAVRDIEHQCVGEFLKSAKHHQQTVAFIGQFELNPGRVSLVDQTRAVFHDGHDVAVFDPVAAATIDHHHLILGRIDHRTAVDRNNAVSYTHLTLPT